MFVTELRRKKSRVKKSSVKKSSVRRKKVIKRDRQLIASLIALNSSQSGPHGFSTSFSPYPIFHLIEAAVNSRHNRLGQLLERVTPLQTKGYATGDLQAVSGESTVI